VGLTAAEVATANEKASGATKNYDRILNEQLLPRLRGVAEAQHDTFGGHLDEYRTRVENFAATIGKSLGPALVTIGPLLMGIGGALQIAVIPGFMGAAAPILAVAAGVALVAGAFYLAYTHIQPFQHLIDNMVAGNLRVFGAILQYLGSDLLPKVSTALGFVGTAASTVATTAWPALLAAGKPLLDAMSTLAGSFLSIFSIFDQTPSHVDPATGSIRGVAGAARDTSTTLLAFALSPAVIGTLAFFAVQLPAALKVTVGWYKVLADNIAISMNAIVTTLKVGWDIARGDVVKAAKDAAEGFSKGQEDIKRLATDTSAVLQSVNEVTDGTIERRTAAFKARQIAAFAEMGAGIDSHTEGLATTTKAHFDATTNAAAGASAAALHSVSYSFGQLHDSVINSVADMQAQASARFQQMAYNMTQQARQLYDSISGHSIIPDMAKAVVKSFDWMKGESLGHWADMSKGITAHAKGMASPGASAWGGGSAAVAGGGGNNYGGGGGGVVVHVTVQGPVLNWNQTAEALAMPIRDALIQKKRTLGTLWPA